MDLRTEKLTKLRFFFIKNGVHLSNNIFEMCYVCPNYVHIWKFVNQQNLIWFNAIGGLRLRELDQFDSIIFSVEKTSLAFILIEIAE